MKTKRRVFMLIAALAAILAAPAIAPAQGILQLHDPGEKLVSPEEPGAEASGVQAARVEPAPKGENVRILPLPRPRPIPIPPRPWNIFPADVVNVEISCEIDGQVATTILDQTFRNPNDRRLEGTYLFPLPPNAVIRDMSLFIDGKPVKCEVIEAKKARAIYEDIVRRARDPALLEYVGRDLIQLRIFPVEPHQERRVKFQYSQVLKRDFGLTEYSYPLADATQGGRTIGHFSLAGTIHADQPITTVYSPTHDIQFTHKDEKNVKFSFEQNNHKPSANVEVFYGVSEKELGAGLVTWRKKGEEGYFMLMVAPRAQAPGGAGRKVLPKDVTFVFDTSGSMSGPKIEQAKRALAFCLNSLREEDCFNIIRFSTEVDSFAPGLVAASKDKVKEALAYVGGLTATGGTAINDALLAALGEEGVKGEKGGKSEKGEEGGKGEKGEMNRPHLIVFLTDGEPTIGERNPDAIVRNVSDKNENHARIFSFGVGNEVNTRLLDRLSEAAGGVSDYVTPSEDIEVKVSNFFAKVSDPVMTDLAVEYGGLKVSKTYPKDLPDLFAGSQITIIGRYEDSGKKTVVLTGKEGGEKRAFEYELEFPDESASADFLPRLWAIRRVGYLVDEIRKNGESQELRDEVTRLGKQYAIATPYTSMLVMEDQPVPVGMQPMSAPMRQRFGDGGPIRVMGAPSAMSGPAGATGPAAASQDVYAPAPREGAKPAIAASLRAETGAAAVAMSKETRRQKETERVTGAEEKSAVKDVAGRTFELKDGVWTDSQYDGKAKTIDIEYGSDAYFQLLNKGGDIGKFLALGTKVIFSFDGKWYRITAPADEKKAGGEK